MDDVKRYVNLSFIIAALIMSWFYMQFTSWLLSVFHVTDERLMGEHVTYSTIAGIVLGVVTAIILSRRARVYEGALNVAREMKKVTWPTGDETKYAMKVVIITTIIVALILFCFDIGAKLLTDMIFEIGNSGNKS